MARLDECYQVLGIEHGAAPEEVEEAYGELAKVWRPERFLNDERIRRLAEKKMIEIDAARDTLLEFLGTGEKSRPAAGANGRAVLLNRACDNPRCTGILDRNGDCDVCGKRSAPDSIRYAVFCPACGTRNVVASQRDYERGVCSGCKLPLCAPVRLAPKSSRKIAYLVLCLVLSALAWLFISSSSERTQGRDSKTRPLHARALPPSAAPLADTAPQSEASPSLQPERHPLQSRPATLHPLPQQTGQPPEKQVSSPKTSRVGEIPGTPAGGVTARPPSQPLQVDAAPRTGGPKPAEQTERSAAEPGTDSKASEQAFSNPSEPAEQENYYRLIDELAKKKAGKPQGRVGDLRNLPFDKLKE